MCGQSGWTLLMVCLCFPAFAIMGWSAFIGWAWDFADFLWGICGAVSTWLNLIFLFIECGNRILKSGLLASERDCYSLWAASWMVWGVQLFLFWFFILCRGKWFGTINLFHQLLIGKRRLTFLDLWWLCYAIHYIIHDKINHMLIIYFWRSGRLKSRIIAGIGHWLNKILLLFGF